MAGCSTERTLKKLLALPTVEAVPTGYDPTMSSSVAEQITVHNPRTGDLVAHVPIASPGRVDDAITRATTAASAWARTDPAERADCLRAAAADVRAAAQELADLNERETGKLSGDARGGVDAGIGTLLQYAELGRSIAGPPFKAAGLRPI